MSAIDPATVSARLARLEAENHRLERRVEARDAVVRDLLRTIAELEAGAAPGPTHRRSAAPVDHGSS